MPLNNTNLTILTNKGDDDLTGIVEIKMNKIKKFEHTGVRIELVGHIGKKVFFCYIAVARYIELA